MAEGGNANQFDRPSPTPDFRLWAGLVTSLIALALGGTGVYSSQDRFTKADANRMEQRVYRTIDDKAHILEQHLATHPDDELDRRLRAVEIAVARRQGEVK